MKLTTRSEYALLALLFLARHEGDEPVSGEIIAQEQGIPPKFLQQILLALKRARYVHSAKGQRAGICSPRNPPRFRLLKSCAFWMAPWPRQNP